MTAILSELPLEPIATGLAGRRSPGDGEKVLWLHGYTLDSSSWGELWQLLPGWRHIGIDLPGHGGSEPMSEQADLRELGQRLGKLCQNEGIRHIVALSFGTITALQIALEFPDDFATLTLGGPSLAGGEQDAEVGRAYMRLFQLYHQSTLSDDAKSKAIRETWMGCRAWQGVDEHPGLRAALTQLVDRHSWAELNGYATRQFTHPPQQAEAIGRIRASLMVLVGDREMPAFRNSAEKIRNAATRCDYQELADTDHLCMLMSPQPSAALIDAHLRAAAE